ncbi:hypothetical protein EHE19_010750 [Ruminiclostridium herbifermentans]|uniref:Uncharacterized protein n=1 Tax=Ruminiclostridium herbifermentans TaxID=2488810 RepID=A0A7H1VJ54_9FIRM|nr:hypothetical protein [Ruminiclostridium herbifermentans]QNU65416.1 hypothetical protein EHE19_010750 [Ruminiclostridium herbifermentans]
MPCVAEFGIIEEFDKDKDYSSEYEPQKYNCVAIDDDILDDWWEELTLIKTYFHCYSRLEYGLARWGVTLIPPESLEAFYNIVSKYEKTKTSEELTNLKILLRKAISENKYVIHYGV